MYKAPLTKYNHSFIQVNDRTTYMVLVFVAYVIYPLQSLLNPLLYNIIAKKWRKDMKVAVRDKRRSCSFLFLDTCASVDYFVDKRRESLGTFFAKHLETAV